MNTTSLFVELLVIGVGGMMWLMLGLAAVFDLGPLLSQFVHLPANALLMMFGPVTALTYVIGIVLDRTADGLFDVEARRLGRKDFFAGANKEEARQARTAIYCRSDRLADLYEYGRSRLRICRGSCLNIVMLILAADGFLLTHASDFAHSGRLMAAVTAGGALVAAGAYWAWRRLLRSESAWLHTQAEVMKAEGRNV